MIIKHLIEHIIYLHYLVTILISLTFKIENRTPVIDPELENTKDMFSITQSWK